MPVIATNTVETRDSLFSEHQQLLVNIEINNSCAYTPVCGNTCYLNVVAPAGGVALPKADVLAAAREVILHGEHVRHLVLPGKEVFETAELLLQIVEEFHGAPEHTRPGDISIITASAQGLHRCATRLAETPLGAVNISLDTAEMGLRNERNNVPLLNAAIALKEIGGTERIGVNTVLTQRNLAAAVEIGKRLRGTGIDQWTLGPLLLPVNGRMESVLSAKQIREAVQQIAEEFAGADLNIVFDLDLPLMRKLVGSEEVFVVGAQRWRYEYELPGAANILLEAGNPEPGYFFRMNWAGDLISKEDYRRIGTPATYARYSPGRIARLTQELRQSRLEAVCTA